MAEFEKFRSTVLTLPIILVGVLLGSLVCAANVYFGLQIGTANTMSMSTALLSFAIFKSVSRWFTLRFSVTENILVQAIASSVAGTPLTASLWSVIPAYEYVRRDDEGGRRQFTMAELMVWSVGVCLFGTVFSAPFRSYFLRRQRLRFPSGYASGVIVGVLHNDDEVAARAEADKKFSERPQLVAEDNDGVDGVGEQDPSSQAEAQQPVDWKSNVRRLLLFFGGTTVYVILSYFVPQVNQVPIFGTKASRHWLWYITLSPALTAMGVILDFSIGTSMLVGAIVGWGILSPIAKSRGWAPGPVGDMEHGVRGWLMWMSIGVLLGDTFIRFAEALVKLAQRAYRDLAPVVRHKMAKILAPRHYSPIEQPLLGQSTTQVDDHESSDAGKAKKGEGIVPNRVILLLFVCSIGLCIICTWYVFGDEVSLYLVVVAVAITLPLCLVVIQSSGETDSVPSNALSNACQIIFGAMISPVAAQHLGSMILGAVTEGGLWQSAVLMSDLKAAYLVQASPKIMFFGQILGSILGAFVGSGIYRVFTRVYEIPSAQFPVPFAYMWANTARLAAGGQLPDGVKECFWVMFGLAAALRVMALVAGKRSWAKWIPSGVAIAIGMYLPPHVTLAKFIGALIRLYLLQRHGVSEFAIICAGTGCVLGEGTFGLLPGIFAILGVPRLFA